ncbi:hypothetical protein [Neolewinella persica]|uniref:hypothetical protein n=1 Tax=Neolewinella persica TaxID=70998 RepID=UPI00036E4937|nr:hypothetical protein [Neolewinella persica]
MTKALLLFALLCTCGPAQMLAQFTFSVNTGYSFGTFNQQPELVGDIIFTGEGGYLNALNSASAGLEVNYAPANTNFSGGLQMSYSRRGYEHLIELANGEQEHSLSHPSHVDYLDISPRLTYRPRRLFSASIGPFLSLGRKFEDNPFVIERERRTNTHDYGIKVAGRLHFGRAYVYAAYQRSFREYDYTGGLDGQSSVLLLSVEQPSPISALQAGLGFTLIR